MTRFARTLAALAVCAAPLTSCGGSEAPSGQARNPLLRPAAFAETAPAEFTVRFETSAGAFVVEVHRDWAPLGADRFYNLVKGGFYDDVRIYRVIDGFMAQFGLNGDPYVNQAWKTAFIVDDPVMQTNSRGRVTFAKGGLHSRTTEIFINYRDNSSLDDDRFAPFGEVVEGMEVVDAFYKEYGETQPRGEGPYAAMAQARGNEYLDADYPELTKILSATLVDGGRP